MNTQHKINLIKTAIALIEDTKAALDMWQYCAVCNEELTAQEEHLQPGTVPEVIYNCGTTTCFAGYGPVALGHTNEDLQAMMWEDKKDDENEWCYYVRKFYGVGASADNNTEGDWNFLFDQDWPDDKEQCAARAYLYITEGGIPEVYKEIPDADLYCFEYPGMEVLKKLLEELENEYAAQLEEQKGVPEGNGGESDMLTS